MAEFNKYQVIKGAISYELANFVFNYFLLKRDAVDWMYKNNITYDNGMLGTWTDDQVPNTLFSGVYYIKTSPNCGKLVCNDPRPGIQTVMPTRIKGKPPKHLWREVHLDPIEGRIIIFPAWLWHGVEPNQSNDIRISVSFNFIQEGFQ